MNNERVLRSRRTANAGPRGEVMSCRTFFTYRLGYSLSRTKKVFKKKWTGWQVEMAWTTGGKKKREKSRLRVINKRYCVTGRFIEWRHSALWNSTFNSACRVHVWYGTWRGKKGNKPSASTAACIHRVFLFLPLEFVLILVSNGKHSTGCSLFPGFSRRKNVVWLYPKKKKQRGALPTSNWFHKTPLLFVFIGFR